MGRGLEAYSPSRKDNVLIDFCKRANAPERGTVFTARAIKKPDKRDLIIGIYPNYTIYVRRNLDSGLVAKEGQYYRFKIVAGPYTEGGHNYCHAIPTRELAASECRDKAKLDPVTGLFIQRLGEFLLGIGWDRRTKRNYFLKKEQQTWGWFYKNFR